MQKDAVIWYQGQMAKSSRTMDPKVKVKYRKKGGVIFLESQGQG